MNAQILKGVGKINGDGWKDTTLIGQVVYVWNAELPEPHKPGQYPRINNPGWSASTDQYDFAPATVDEAKNALEGGLPGMSTINRTIAYTACEKLRSLGYEWDERSEAWVKA